MEEDRKTLEQNFAGVDFQIFPTDYHTCVYPVFLLEKNARRSDRATQIVTKGEEHSLY